MLFEPTIGTGLSGRLGGIVASHGPGGAYFRKWVVPVNPSTPAQNIVRASFGLYANKFATELSEAQRQSWKTYSDNVPLTGRTGIVRSVGAIGMFQRTNTPRVQAGLPEVLDAPTIFTTGAFTPVTDPTALETADVIGFAFTDTDEWVGEDDAAMLVYSSAPQNPGITFFGGPYRFAGTILGDGTTPPTTPATITNPFVLTAGQRVFWRVQVTRADGRLSSDQNLTAIAA